MSISKMIRQMILPAALMIAGCDVDLGFGNNVTDDNFDDQDPTLQNVQEEIFTPYCSNCHRVGGSAYDTVQIELNIAQNSYDTLVGGDGLGEDSIGYPGIKLVNPGNPDASFIVWKVEGDASRWGRDDSGSRMPLNGDRLSTRRINFLRDWIAQGALRFGDGSTSAAIVSNANANVTATDTVTFSLHFSQPMDETSFDSDTLLVYAKINGEYQLLDYEHYSLAIVDSNDVDIDVETAEILDPQTYEPATIEAIKLVINDESIASVMDANGYLLDGDNDKLPGGAYEYIYTVNEESSD